MRIATIAVLLGSVLAVASMPAASGTRPQSLILFNAAPEVETAFGVVHPDRKGRRVLSNEYSAVAWSPNGRRILAYGGPTGLAILDDQARLVRALPMQHGFFNNVAWSPDGRWIGGVVDRCPSLQPFCGDLRILKVDGSEDRLLADAGVLALGRGELFAWAPGGREIVYSGSPTSVLQEPPTYQGLVIVTLTGKKVTYPSFHDGVGPTWAPSGRRLAFSRDNNLYAVRRDGTNIVRLRQGNDWFEPSWSPTGAASSTARAPSTCLTWHGAALCASAAVGLRCGRRTARASHGRASTAARTTSSSAALTGAADPAR